MRTSLEATPSRSHASMAGVMPSPLGSGCARLAAENRSDARIRRIQDRHSQQHECRDGGTWSTSMRAGKWLKCNQEVQGLSSHWLTNYGTM